VNELVAQVLAVLKEGAERIKPDLWHAEDLPALELVAKDLVHLAAQLPEAPSATQALIRRRAKLLVHHVELLALRRARVLEQEAQEEIERIFREHVLPALLGLLPAVL
jgi:hypothetical protein